MGIVTTVLFFNYMNQQKEAPALKDVKYINVLAAKQEINENTKITSDMLEVISVPESAVLPQALKTATEAEGKIAAASMAAGEILLANHLKDQKDEALFVSKKVREGYRAMSIGVNIVQSVSNLIEPGDHVDIVYSKEDKTKGPIDPNTGKTTGTFESEILLKDVPVLAIGRRMVEAEADTPYAEYAQVTLELTPEDGVTAINADEDPDVTLSLMLHSRLDNAQEQQTQPPK